MADVQQIPATDTSDTIHTSDAVSTQTPDAVSISEDPSRKASKKHAEHPVPYYTVGEEIANAVTHGIGTLLAIAAFVLLIVRAASHGAHPAVMASAIIFGVSLILEYLMSTLYHALSNPRAKRVFRIFDHSCIYLLIAGSYTPFTLGPLLNSGGIPLMIAVWVFAFLGIAMELILRQRQSRWVTIVIYLIMGWLVVLRLPQLIELLEPGCLWLLVAGGLCYTVGTVFYLMKRIRYMHSIWHLWVLGGSICMFFSVILYII